MSDDKRNSAIAITVAIIGLVGVLGGAVISYWDKLGLSRRGAGAPAEANCELGFRGSLDEWERLMGAVARR